MPTKLQPDSQQTEEAFFKLVILVIPAVQSLISGDGSKLLHGGGGGGGGRVNFDAQAVGIELDKAIGDLNTQLNLLAALSKGK